MKKVISILVLLVIKIVTVNSAFSDSVFCYIGFQAHYGFIIPHSSVIKDISHTKPYGFELSYNRFHTSFQDWRVFNSYWISGLESRYFNYQNPDILGKVFDITIFAEPVIRFRNKYLFCIRGGIGISYHTKIYDETENPINHFFSSKISFPLYVDLRLKYKFAGNNYLTFSGCYNHISNGGFKLPNKGMNFPTLAIGLEMHNKSMPPLHHDFFSILEEKKKETFLILQMLSSVKVLSSTAEFAEKAVFVYGFHSRVSCVLGTFYALNIGAEFIFDYYIRETIKREQTGIDYKRFALTFGQDFMLGKMIFTQYLGTYIYSPFKARNAIYQKYELLYQFSKGFIAGVYLKSHLHVAELMGVSVNYKIKLNK